MEKAKPIQKKLLHAGVGPSDIDIPDGTKLKFHFVTKVSKKIRETNGIGFTNFL